MAQLSALLASLTLVVSMAWLAWWVATSVSLQQIQWQALPGLFSLFCLRYLSAAAASYCGQRLAETAQDRVREQLIMRWCDADPVGASTERANLLIEPIEQLYGYFARFVPQLTTAVATPLLILGIVVYHDWVAATFLLVAAPIIPLFMALVGIGAARLSNRHIRTTQRLAGLFVDRVRHLINLKLFAAEVMAVEDIRAASERMRMANMATLRVAFLSSAVLEFFASVAIAAVAIYVGFSLLGYFTFEPAAQMTFVAGFTVLLLAPDFFQPLRNLSAHYHDRAEALAAAGLLAEELRSAPRAAGDFAARSDASDADSTDSLQQSPRQEFEPRPPKMGRADTTQAVRLELQDLSFAYQTPLIAHLNLSLQGGDICLLKGPSGTGKSTLLKLLSGQLMAGEGAISRPTDTHIAYMAQEPYLQAGTISDNLRLVCTDAQDTDMRQALAKAELRKPLDYPIAERGQGLSGGEQRRLALARMFLHPSRLMLFDEPTAGLDAATAHMVASAIRALQAPDRILVIASHDPRLDALATIVLTRLR